MKVTKSIYIYILLTICALCSIAISNKSIKNPQSLIWSDMEGYYVYLPSIFIYGGFDKAAVRDTNYLRTFPGTNKIYTKYTCGVAILEMPFFLAAHILSKPLGFENDGKSLIYCYALMLSGLFYCWLGLYFLFRYCSRYFKQWTVLIALLGIFFGTNLYYYTFFQPSMSHVYSFFLFAAFLLLTDDLFVQKKYISKMPGVSWALFGLVFGLIIVVRPTNFIIGLIPIYIWGKTQSQKWAYLRQNLMPLLLALAAFAIPFLLQMSYWKYISNQWITWSYSDESFKFWKEPKLFRVLFDAWNGWILYSPIVLFPLFFLTAGRNSNRYFERIYLVIFAIATYIFASWWAWWFGGAFGHRSYVEYLAFLVLPFAVAIEKASRVRIRFVLFLILFVLCCYYNLGLTYAYNAPWDGPNWTYDSLWLEIKKLF